MQSVYTKKNVLLVVPAVVANLYAYVPSSCNERSRHSYFIWKKFYFVVCFYENDALDIPNVGTLTCFSRTRGLTCSFCIGMAKTHSFMKRVFKRKAKWKKKFELVCIFYFEEGFKFIRGVLWFSKKKF